MRILMCWPDGDTTFSGEKEHVMNMVEIVLQHAIITNVMEDDGHDTDTKEQCKAMMVYGKFAGMSIAEINQWLYDIGWVSYIEDLDNPELSGNTSRPV